MRTLMLASGLGLALINFSFADEPVAVDKAKLDAIAECLKKPSDAEKDECKKAVEGGGAEAQPTGEGVTEAPR